MNFKSLRSRFTLLVGVPILSGVAWSLACHTLPSGGGVDDVGGTAPPAVGACGHPHPGCPCTAAGTTAECGQVESQIGNYVTCSMGKTTCDGTTWGPCVGDLVATKTVGGGQIVGNGLKIAALGLSSSCGSGNLCDPDCNNFVDTPGGFDAAGLCGAAGLGVCAPGNLCMCEQPADPVALYGNLPASFRGNPASCAGGAADDCEHDGHCDAATSTCARYDVAGTNAACTTAPDFTVGMGCQNGGGDWRLEICNRGLVSANTGSLVVAVNDSSPTGTPGVCPFPSGPPLPATGTRRGTCTINLATTTIGPGQCISVDPATACTARSGGAIDFSGTRTIVVNPTASILTGATPLPECDACNNYSAVNPGLPAAAACSTQICGTVCGGYDAGAGAGCHTYVSGTVYDPGANAPLPGIAVYQPSGALISFPPGVHCDSCTSLLSPYVSSTFSDLSGGFHLEVTGTTNIPVVFQTGRWRRQVTIPSVTACQNNVITVPADCTYPGTACLTRLPRTSAEGDIPLTAIVMGNKEPGECLFAKIMGGTSEMSPAMVDPAIGGRIRLFHGSGANTNPMALDGSALWASQASLNAFDQVYIPCNGSDRPVLTPSQQGYFANFGNSGGRLFLDHKSAVYTLSDNGGDHGFAPWNTTCNFSTVSTDQLALPQAQCRVLGNESAHTNFRTWLTNVSAYGAGYVPTPTPSDVARVPSHDSFEWVRGESHNNWALDPSGDYSLSYSFDLNAGGITPTLAPDGGAGAGCGRVIYNAMHVNTSRGQSGGTFPAECFLGAPLTPNELMFEYLLFELSSCSIGGAPVVPSSPPPPPAPPVLGPVSLTREYKASCAPGYGPKWTLFEWRAVVPPGTSILFLAETAPDVSGDAGAYGAPVPIGEATRTTPPSHMDTGGYPGSCDGGVACACTVDDHLRDLAAYGTPPRPECQGSSPDSPQTSQEWLRVTMTFNPAGPISPVLQNWVQQYDCVPVQ